MFSLPVLEHQLVMYVTSDGRDTFNKAFDLSNVPVVTREQADAEDRTKKLTTAMPTLKAPNSAAKKGPQKEPDGIAAAAAASQKYSQQLKQIPEIAAYGNVLKSSQVVELTESETEYVVTAVKHIFKDHIVLQFDIKNTYEGVVLTDVTVVSATSDETEGLEEDFIIPVPKLSTNEPATAYVAFKRLEGAEQFLATQFSNALKFTTKEIDPSTGEPEEGGYEDEYGIEPLSLTGADYVLPAFAGSFDNVWSETQGEESSETLQFESMKSIAGKSLLNSSSVTAY